MMRSYLFFGMLLTATCLPAADAGAQQAFTYTQYMTNLTPYNTAASLLDESGAVNLSARKQWIGVKGAPSSVVFSGCVPFRQIGASGGLVMMHDEFGVEKLTEVNAFFAKSVRLSEMDYLAASFNAGIRLYNAAYSELDPYDPKFMDNIRETVGTTGLSVLWYNPERYYAGVSLPRLSIRSLGKASVEDRRNYRNTWYFSGAYLHEVGDMVKVKPAVLFSYTRSLPLLTDVSATLYLNGQLGLGAGYRSNKEISGIVSWFFENNFSAGYSYQTGFGKARVGNSGNATHEISIGYRFGFFTAPRLL